MKIYEITYAIPNTLTVRANNPVEAEAEAKRALSEAGVKWQITEIKAVAETVPLDEVQPMVMDTEALELIDKTILEISGREIVSTAEMTDLLLDVRLFLMSEAESKSFIGN